MGAVPQNLTPEVIRQARKLLMIAEIRSLNYNPDLRPASYYYQQVVDDFAGTPYAAEAARRLGELEEGQ